MMYPEVCVVVWFTLCCVGIWCVAMQRTCAPRLSGRAKAQTPAADYWTSYRVRTLTTHVLNTLFESTKSQFKSHKHENTDRETHYTGPQTSSLKPTAWSHPPTHPPMHAQTHAILTIVSSLCASTHTHIHTGWGQAGPNTLTESEERTHSSGQVMPTDHIGYCTVGMFILI